MSRQGEGGFEVQLIVACGACPLKCSDANGQDQAVGRLEEGDKVELGDIMMQPGLLVRGRITDESGQPIAGCSVRVVMDRSRRSNLLQEDSTCLPVTMTYGRSDGTGRFELRDRLLSGTWPLRMSRERLSPDKLVLPKDQKEIHVEIRVKSLERTEHIQGQIVDVDGRPLRGARIAYSPRPWVGRPRRGIQSKKDGRFEILRSKKDTGVPVRLRIVNEGFNTLDSTEELAWNIKDHRLVMTRGKALSLRVIDAETKRPVEEFGILLEPLGPSGLVSWRLKTKYWAVHKDGILSTAPIGKGAYNLKVVPITSHVESDWLNIDLPLRSPTPLLVRLHRLVNQQLLVVSHQGVPIVGTQVELLEARQGLPIDAKTYVLQSGIGVNQPNRAYLWTKGKTDSSGILMLSGPPSRELGLRIHGADHVPLYVNGTRLTKGGSVLTVRVQKGASLVGRVLPLRVIAGLDALAESIPKGLLRRAKPQLKAGLILRAAPPPGKFSFRTYPTGWNARWPIAEDGSFRIAGIEPGTWILQLVWTLPANGSFRFDQVDLQRLENLRDGEERKLDIDISHFLLGEVEGTVLLNGTPPKGTELVLQARKESFPRGQTSPLYVTISLGDKATFRKQLIPAIYDCHLRIKKQGGGQITDYPIEAPLRVMPGGKQTIKLELQTTVVQFQFLNHDGKPLGGLRTSLLPQGMKKSFNLLTSNESGESTMTVPTGSFQLMIPPKQLSTELSTPEGYKAFIARLTGNVEKAFADAHISIRSLHIAPRDESQEITITIPREAGY